MGKTKNAEAVPKEEPKCNLMLPTDSKVKLDGFNGIGVNDKVRLMVTGTVKALSDSAEEWSPGKQVTINVTKCKITGPRKETTINDALAASVDRV